MQLAKNILSAYLMVILCLSCKSQKSTPTMFVLPSTKEPFYIFDGSIEKMKDEFKNGRIEAFSINGASFRFQRNESLADHYNLEVLKNGKWETNLSLKMPRDKEKFHLTVDFDLDNAIDLSFIEYGNVAIYFFDKSKKQFDTSKLTFSFDYVLLDKARLIYGANDQKGMLWNVGVFSISGRKKYHFMEIKMPLLGNKKNGGFEITNAFVYQCKNGIQSDTSLVNNISIRKQFSDFSLRQFMKDMVKDRLKPLSKQ